MNVTIIGVGNMGRGIGTRLVSGGHSVTFVDASPETAEKTAADLKASARHGGQVTTASLGDVKLGDVVVLAVWYGTNIEIARQLGAKLAGKVVVDIANPLNSTYDGLATSPDSSSAEDLARAIASGAKVVKAFNTTYAGTLVAGQVAGQPLDVGYDRCLHRLVEFNRRERTPRLRGAARRLCASIGVYPTMFFARRGGAGRLLGPHYREACARLVAMLAEARRTAQAPQFTELRASLEAVLQAAVDGIAPVGVHGVKAGVFDQLVGPPYTDHAVEALPVIVDDPPAVLDLVLPALQQGLVDIAFVQFRVAHQRDHARVAAGIDHAVQPQVILHQGCEHRLGHAKAHRPRGEIHIGLVLGA